MYEMQRAKRIVIPTLHIVTSDEDDSFISIIHSHEEYSPSHKLDSKINKISDSTSEHTLSSFIEPLLYQTPLYSQQKQLKSPQSSSISSVISDYQYPLSDLSTSSIHTEFSFDFQTILDNDVSSKTNDDDNK